MKKVNEEELNQVSGGYVYEIRELAEFINAHGGNISYGNNMSLEVSKWLQSHHKELGIGLARYTFNASDPNVYRFWDETHRKTVPATHEEVMARLRAVYGE